MSAVLFAFFGLVRLLILVALIAVVFAHEPIFDWWDERRRTFPHQRRLARLGRRIHKELNR